MKLNNVVAAAILAAGMFCGRAAAQEIVPPETQPVTGTCVVSLGNYFQLRETCELTTEGGTVPNGFRLTIEQLSAACSTHPYRGIYTLALITKASAESRGAVTHIPVTAQTATMDQVRLVGAQRVRIYGGSGTKVELLTSTWQSAPAGFTSCDVTFSGVLTRVS